MMGDRHAHCSSSSAGAVHFLSTDCFFEVHVWRVGPAATAVAEADRGLELRTVHVRRICSALASCHVTGVKFKLMPHEFSSARMGAAVEHT